MSYVRWEVTWAMSAELAMKGSVHQLQLALYFLHIWPFQLEACDHYQRQWMQSHMDWLTYIECKIP